MVFGKVRITMAAKLEPLVRAEEKMLQDKLGLVCLSEYSRRFRYTPFSYQSKLVLVWK